MIGGRSATAVSAILATNRGRAPDAGNIRQSFAMRSAVDRVRAVAEPLDAFATVFAINLELAAGDRSAAS